jgi:hypothetical protein
MDGPANPRNAMDVLADDGGIRNDDKVLAIRNLEYNH